MRDGISNRIIDAVNVKDAKVNFVVKGDIHGQDENMVIRGRCSKRVEDVDGVGAIGVDHEAINTEPGKMLSEIMKHCADGKSFEKEYVFGSTY